MSQKKLEPGSEYEKYDLDGDGIVTDEEFEMDQKLVRLENEDKKEDAQRHMAWFALFGMLLYPALVVASVYTGLDKAAGVLGDMAPTYFVSVAAIVAAFFGKEAYVKSKEPKIRIVVREPNKVTQGHTPNRPRGQKEKRIRREFCD